MTTRARGADFSSNQTVEETARVADGWGGGIRFAFVKASQGVDYVNPLFVHQVDVLRSRGVKVGYYHYLDPGVDGAAQWDHFEQSISRVRAPVALDYEAEGTTDQQAKAFIARGRQRGYRVGLYGGAHIVSRRLGQAWRWIADYSQAPPSGRWDVWQFTDTGGVQDFNVFRAGNQALAAWWDRQAKPRRGKVKPRWWLTDTEQHTALGPYWLLQVGIRLLAYARQHPHSHTYTLERK